MAATECANVATNETNCACTYTSCPTHGVCCDCLRKHLAQQQLPGCCFPPEVERTYDRSFKKFVETYKHLLDQ